MTLHDLEQKAVAGEALTHEEAALVLSNGDLVAVGALGEAARRSRRGDRVTWGRVAIADTAKAGPAVEAGEYRLAAPPVSKADARERTRRVVAGSASGTVITGFSLSDLLALCDGDLAALAEFATGLRSEGLIAVAETPIDRFADARHAIDAVRAVSDAGLGVWRVTIDRVSDDERLTMVARVSALQEATKSIRAFAPLPRLAPEGAPSTGYDDVRTVAVARLMLPHVEHIQVDWPLYGPKLAQVAIAFGASDIDGVAAIDDGVLGARRSPKADMERQIRAAGAEPVERDGRYDPRA